MSRFNGARSSIASILAAVALAGCAADTTNREGGATDGAMDHFAHDAYDVIGPDTRAVDAATSDAADVIIDAGHDAAPVSCDPIPGATYGRVTIIGPASPRPVAMHPDVNLLLRTWRTVGGAAMSLFYLNHPTDTLAPRLNTLFTDLRIPTISGVYAVQNWDWSCNCFNGYIASPEVTLVGMATNPGEVIQTPSSGRLIDPGYAAMVLYATRDTITLKYTLADTVADGYTIHIAGVCVDAQLVADYNAANAAGRTPLTALHPLQPLGRASGTEIQVAIRDTGSWMDPRWCNDWWPRCP